jgi:uncharacterized membrane protein
MPAPPRRFDLYTPELGCLLLAVVLAGMCLLPLLFVEAMADALRKLHLSGTVALLTMLGIFLGGAINIPLYRVDRDEEQPVSRGYYLHGYGWIPLPRNQRQTLVAVNLGGCVIPVALALWEVRFILDATPQARYALVVAVAINVVACYWLARPIAGIGIALPAFVPPLLAVGAAWLLLGKDEFDLVRAPVAFVAGVAGPLVGADLLHLRQFERLSTGLLSIGGAGTFDGIVMSGLLAAFLA